MTPKQEEKLKEISRRAEEFLLLDTTALKFLKDTIAISAPDFLKMSTTGKPPTLEQLETLTARLLAITLASTK